MGNHRKEINSRTMFWEAFLAQLVERQAFNLNVMGSTPIEGEIIDTWFL